MVALAPALFLTVLLLMEVGHRYRLALYDSPYDKGFRERVRYAARA
jgi:hypothetical protein